jgi:hypothetical protein
MRSQAGRYSKWAFTDIRNVDGIDGSRGADWEIEPG